MIEAAPTTVEQALESGAPLEPVLDVVDAAIEQAAADGDHDLLERLSRELAAVADERGGEWRALAIAGARAGALASRAGEARPAHRTQDIPATERSSATPAAPVPRPPAAAPVASAVPTQVAEPPEAERTYAGFGLRTVAFFVDLVVLGVGFAVLGVLSEAGLSIADYVGIVLPLAYFAGMHAFAHGVTLGKALVGVRLETVTGAEVGLSRALGRALTTGLLWLTVIGLLIDVIVLGTDRRKQSVHDKAAGTVVRRVRR